MSEGIVYQPSTVAAISVSDFKRSLAWYNDVLGFETEYAVEEMMWGEVRTNVPGLTIGLQLDPEGSGKAGPTLTFRVADIAAARARLEGKGVKFEGPTEEIPGYVKLATWFDPDGNRFMFAQSLS
jgi:predicted enzyme related to lactoylglutathione lyase